MSPPKVGSSFSRRGMAWGVDFRVWYEVTGFTPKTRFVQYRRLQRTPAPTLRISLARWHREGWAS